MKIDFHTHILPCIDDGADSREKSALMLRQLKKQGIDVVVMTPHYYRDEMTTAQFENAVKQSYHELMEIYSDADMPRLYIGSECAMWDGMSSTDLSSMCIENTNLLMCEMPYRYRPYIIDEFEELKVCGYLPVIAHIDRYLKLYDRKELQRILDLENVIFQVNIKSLENYFIRAEILKLAKRGCSFILGSDCHDTEIRRPEINRKLLSRRSLNKYFMKSVSKNEKYFIADGTND